MQEYRVAMQAVYVGKLVRCALLFSDGRYARYRVTLMQLFQTVRLRRRSIPWLEHPKM